MNSTAQVDLVKEKLLQDLKTVIQEAEQLFASTERQTEYGYKSAIARFERRLRHAKTELTRLEQRVSASGKNVVLGADRLVEDHPWQAVGVSFGIALAFGLLLGRR